MREPDREQAPEEVFEPISTGIGGGRVIVPKDDLIPEAEPHVQGEDPGSEEDRDSAENDAGLLDAGESPEFEHLRKPPPLSNPPGER